jgi:LysR family nitrogen assimilation transcriptional regulator
MTYEQVQLLKILLDTGSLAKAATILDLQPSTLSKSLSRLEERFGVSLFTRHGKGVGPTPAGAMVLEQAILISNQAKVAFHKIQELKTSDDPIMSVPSKSDAMIVAVANELSDVLIGRIFAQLKERLNIDVGLEVLPGRSIEDGVLGGRLDIGLLCDTVIHGDLDSTVVADEAVVIVFGPSLQSGADGITPRLHALTQLPMLMPSWAHSARHHIEQGAAKSGVKFRVHAEIADFSALKTLLRQGLGYSLLPHCAVQEEIARGALCMIPLQGIGGRTGISVVSRPEMQSDPNIVIVRRELALCLEHAAKSSRGSSISLRPVAREPAPRLGAEGAV